MHSGGERVPAQKDTVAGGTAAGDGVGNKQTKVHAGVKRVLNRATKRVIHEQGDRDHVEEQVEPWVVQVKVRPVGPVLHRVHGDVCETRVRGQ